MIRIRSISKVTVICLLLMIIAINTPSAQAFRIGRGQRGTAFTSSEGYFGIFFILDAPQLNIQLKTQYSSTINLSDWKITDNKDLLIDLKVLYQPADIDLWVEHMHADCFLEGTLDTWDGILQDTMDDKIHGTGAIGFYINENQSYSETFSVEGFSQFLTQYWSYYYSYASTQVRMTETRLLDKGVYGVSFRIIYDVCYRYKNDSAEYISKFIVENNIIVDLQEGFKDNEGDKADEPALPTNGFELPLVIGVLVIGAIVYRRKYSQ